MKKLLLVLLTLCVSLSTQAQKILGDDFEDGFRYTATDGLLCKKTEDGIRLYISLTSTIEELRHDTVYSIAPVLFCSFPCEIKMTDAITFILFDGSTIELTAVIGGKSGSPNKYKNSLGKECLDYSIGATYDISRSRLNRIIEKGVKEINIQMGQHNQKLAFQKDVIGYSIEKLLHFLLSKIATPL